MYNHECYIIDGCILAPGKLSGWDQVVSPGIKGKASCNYLFEEFAEAFKKRYGAVGFSS
jgi:hypothetical protein